ncbi:MAG: hypothetical protein LBQ50_01965, partial [Planctomycetaceae bacterium]|nr:hypothetical protein [Planctomycetaceae bacterium]
FEIAAKSTDPSQTVFIRLNIATIQAQLNDKAGVKENLGQLLSFLDGIKDVMTLKGLIQDKPVDAETESTQPVLKLKPPVDEAAVKNVLFEVYASITMLLQQVGEEDKVKISFQKAKQLADSEPDTRIKFAKLLNFAQILARSQQNK